LSGEGTQQRRSSDAALDGIRDLIQLQAEHAKERHDDLVERFETVGEAIKPLAAIDLKQLQEDVKRHNEIESTYKLGKKFLIWFIPIGSSIGLWNWKWLASVLHVHELAR
jgi:hypothetical protein